MTSSDLAVRSSGPVVSGALAELGVHIETSEDGRYRAIVLDPAIRQRANVLLPVSEIATQIPDFTPSLRAAQLDPSPDGPHFYRQGSDKLAPRKQALEVLADLAGVTAVTTRPLSGDELDAHHQRDEHGNVTMRAFGYEATVTIRRSDGTPKHLSAKKVWSPDVEYRKVKQSARDDNDLQRKWLAEREHGPAKCESKAIARAYRALLQIPHTFSPADAAKPFLVVGYQFTPDTTDPLVRRLLMEKGFGAAAEIYPDAQPRQISEGSGPPASDPELEPGSAPAGEATAAQPAPGGPEAAFTGEEPGDAPEETAAGPGAFVLPDAFKKHAGRTLAEVAADDVTYLEWLASDAITLDDVRGAAQAFLAGRPS